MDAFDRYWQWAEKPLDSPLTLPADIHQAVMSLQHEERRDRAKANEAVKRQPYRQARMADQIENISVFCVSLVPQLAADRIAPWSRFRCRTSPQPGSATGCRRIWHISSGTDNLVRRCSLDTYGLIALPGLAK
jgi:hypothetical protein